ncbi:glycosyltransferase family 4 protein [bacterium]|nr:glycosyltransferase family 4 protein [bacterium]MDY3021890.1 glycosyltransferase family 4 protein [Oliverpabstia sp.]
MKILMVNKFYYIKGGSETYYFELKRLLESKGHTVIDFSMQDEKNFVSPYSNYFVENVDYNNKEGIFSRIKAAADIIYSFESKRKFERLVNEVKPDCIHLHIFQHQISPSILDVIKKYHIPTIYTAHDLKMLCLNYKMMHHGKLCEQCRGGKYFYCVLNKCVKDSYLKSCVNVVEGYVHRWRHSYDAINVIITPSLFYKKIFEKFGINCNRVIHIPNFIDFNKHEIEFSEDRENYYLYYGRLSKEKGIMTLIKAVENLNVQLKIAGTGPLEEDVRQYVADKKISNIMFLGFKTGKDLSNIVGNAKAIILPSEWYENGPYSAIEALQLGRPIIGADIGGIPELIDNNGYLFKSRNIDSLKDAILKLEKLDNEQYGVFKDNSLNLFERNYTNEKHYRLLKEAYRRAGIADL